MSVLGASNLGEGYSEEAGKEIKKVVLFSKKNVLNIIILDRLIDLKLRMEKISYTILLIWEQKGINLNSKSNNFGNILISNIPKVAFCCFLMKCTSSTLFSSIIFQN